MTENLVFISWTESSKAYKAMNDLRNGTWNFNLLSAALVERKTDGQLVVKDAADNVVGLGTLGGSLIGMVVGVLGGPVGVLLGWASGALFGSLVDLDSADDEASSLTSMSRFLLPGQTALMLDVEEQSDAALDAFAAQSGGVLLRKSAAVVRAEVAAAEEAARVASKEANRVLREERRAEAKDKAEKAWDNLKAKFKKAVG